MSEPSTQQRYHLVLADIAMAVSIRCLGGALAPEDLAVPEPGALRDRWLARTPEGEVRRRVCAMANAAVASLKELSSERLVAAAASAGLPISAEMAASISAHFEGKRSAVLTYRR